LACHHSCAATKWLRPSADEFRPGRSFSFVIEGEPEILVEASTLNVVAGPQHASEVLALAEDNSYKLRLGHDRGHYFQAWAVD
jgi:hypothetical protein